MFKHPYQQPGVPVSERIADLLNRIAATLICGSCRAYAQDPGFVFPQPAYTTEQFVDFIGLSASPFEIRYRAAAEGQTLAIRFTLDSEPNRFLGQARLGAATLARTPTPASGEE
jgi:hypothetical protein